MTPMSVEYAVKKMKHKNIYWNAKENVIPDYENLFHGKMSEQLEIAKIFNENMKLKEKLLSEEDKTWWEI